MRTKYNDYLEPRYELDVEETRELEETGYVIPEGLEHCFVKLDGSYLHFKLDDNFTSIKLNCEEE